MIQREFENLGYGIVNEDGDIVPHDDVPSGSHALPNHLLTERMHRKKASEHSRQPDLSPLQPNVLIATADNLLGLKVGGRLPFLDLHDRAVALDTVMDFHNYDSRVAGRKSDQGHDSMRLQYGRDSGRISAEMDKKLRERRLGSEHAIGVLAVGSNATAAERIAGAKSEEDAIKSELASRFGHGQRHGTSGDRDKLRTKVFKTAGTTYTEYKRHNKK